ncbi:MAG: VCBS repeat-containing protein [Candidatus Manganitrophaceae bacterium]|nr:MAG: VCBS repeat-containing protein [Candidatus Manganitrophaceae bacterium]
MAFSFNMVRMAFIGLLFSLSFSLTACSDSDSLPQTPDRIADNGVAPVTQPADQTTPPPNDSGPLPAQPAGQQATSIILPVQAPKLQQTLPGGDEGWLSSPAVADLDQDGYPEIIAARSRTVYVWHSDGTLYWKGLVSTAGRIWAPAVVADLDNDGRLEIAVGSHQERISVFAWDGKPKAGWPKVLGGNTEIRSLAAGIISPAEGKMGLLAARTLVKPIAFLMNASGAVMPGWPQLSSSTGCTPKVTCWEAGAYNQNVGIADFDGDGKNDMLIGYDNAYVGVFKLNGAPFPSAPVFKRRYFPGVPAFHSLQLAQQGWGPDGTDRSEFTDSPPVVADLDGDGKRELILVGDHELAGNTTNRGNALFVFHADATRQAGFGFPFETAGPLVFDDPGANIVDTNPSPAVVDLDGDGKKEILFPSYDGNLYAVRSDGKLFWKFSFAANGARFATEPVVADLNKDGIPEVLFATYETTPGKGALIVLNNQGAKLVQTPLPGRGSMSAPTLADVYRNGELEVIVNLKDPTPQGGIQIYDLPGSNTNKVLWPTGRGNYLRNGDATR